MHWQNRSRRKATGGRYHKQRGGRRAELGRHPAETHIGESRRRVIRTRGGNRKVRALRCNVASVSIPSRGETKRATIENVEGNPANPNYVRRNLLTKGAIIRTDLGLARITSRPGQHGVISAVLIEE
ncbi:MAG: 30S ribosomal protein S8e [Methanoculleaceae archaeon]